MASSAPVAARPDAPGDANALAPHVWPDGATRDASGRLVVGGVDAVSLAERFGTPLYVVDEHVARRRAAPTRAAIETAPATNGPVCRCVYSRWTERMLDRVKSCRRYYRQ